MISHHGTDYPMAQGWDTQKTIILFGDSRKVIVLLYWSKPVDPELKCGSFSKLPSLRTEVQWVNSNYSLAFFCFVWKWSSPKSQGCSSYSFVQMAISRAYWSFRDITKSSCWPKHPVTSPYLATKLSLLAARFHYIDLETLE